ncbi:MAG TPA: thiamine pyrophosphate-binding protein [Streptosporangiaceae bacterium]
MPERDHAGRLLAALLAEHGVRHVFGVPGGQTLALYDGILDQAGLAHVLTRDERSAAYAADGYARVTGQVGVCDATVGPGAAKLPSGLSESLCASVPVVALVSDLPARLAPHRYRGAASQALDQAGLLAPVTKWQATVPTADVLPALVRQAFRVAASGRPGPAVLFLPQDVLDGPAGLGAERRSGPQPARPASPASAGGRSGGSGGSSPRASTARFGRFPPFRPVPEQADLAAAAAVLRAAQRPFILAGGGVQHSGAGAELTALAERASAAVGSTLSGKGVIAEDHPLSVGVTGSMGTTAAAAAFAEADVVLLAGCKAGSGATYGWTLPHPGQAVLQLDLDPAELGRAFPLRAALLGDARAGLAALLAALDDDAGAAQPDRSAWRDRLAGLTAAWRATRDAERGSGQQPIAPQRVLAELETALGPGDVLICDASLASGWGGVYLEQRHPGRRVLCPRGQAGLGYALPAAIGVATAGHRTVVLTGDGALGYAAGELATVAELGLPVTVIVLNNRSLGWIRWYRRITFGRGWEDDDFADVAFGDIARGFGLNAARVSEPGRLAGALHDALAGPPALLDVVTDAWQTPITAHRNAVSLGAERRPGGSGGSSPRANTGYGG